MEQKNKMLRLGGYINIIIAIGHIVGLFFADKMFEMTGIGKEMTVLSQTHATLPYLLTVLTAVVFFVFGLYGLSAHGKLRKLPFLEFMIFLIAGIYLLRGLGELTVDFIQGSNSLIETAYSLIALSIGFLFLIGGMQLVNSKPLNINQN